MTSSAGGHILVFPFPAQGHILPLLDLTHHILTSATVSLTVTVVVTPKNLQFLQPLLSIHPPSAIAAVAFLFPTHPSIPSGAENLQDIPPESMLAFMSNLSRLRRPIIKWFSAHPSPPSVILSDVLLGWTQRLATELGVKRIVFSPSSALTVSVFGSVWRSRPAPSRSEDGKVDEDAIVSIDNVPGQPRFSWCQLTLLYRAYATGMPGSEFLRVEWEDNSASWGWVFNSFTDLERPYLSHLRTEFGHERIWAVGPILPPDGKGPNVRGGGAGLTDGDRVLSWLDTCGDAEVVYVCFGSQAVLRNEQLEVLALALEMSGARFVWKVKEPTKGHVSGEIFGKLPPGFEDRVAGRGLVIRGWAPQVSILRHRAVGVFMTHCGWNSVLEGLSAGTFMLAWPQGADQFNTALLLVEQLKVAVKVGQGVKLLPDPDELDRVISGSVSGAYKEEGSNALKMKKMVVDAVSQGGVSTMALDSLVQTLSNLPKPDVDVIGRCARCLGVDEEELVGGGESSI